MPFKFVRCALSAQLCTEWQSLVLAAWLPSRSPTLCGPNCKATSSRTVCMYEEEYKGDDTISHMLQANGSFEWCPFNSHTQFWSRRRTLTPVHARICSLGPVHDLSSMYCMVKSLL